METAREIIMSAIGPGWNRVTTVAWQIKNRNAFRGDYSKVVSGMFDAQREGLVEIKNERTGKAGPKTRFIRKRCGA